MEVFISPGVEHFFSHIKIMLEDRYKNNPLYKNSLIILGYHVLKDLNLVRQIYKGMKIIVYQLEQHEFGRPWTNLQSKRILLEADEVWDYDIDNINWLFKNWKITSTYHPVFYSKELYKVTNKEPENDIIFYGAHNKHRDEVFSHLLKLKCPVKWISAYNDDLLKEICNSKIILNIHHYLPARQEQTRIFIPIINKRCVISEFSNRDYFTNMIIQTKTLDEMVSRCFEMLELDKWKLFGIQSHNLFLRNTL